MIKLSFLRPLIELFAKPFQLRQVNVIDMWQAGRPLTDRYDVAKLNDEGYRRNTIVYSCITEIAKSFSGPECLAYQAGEQDEFVLLPREHMLRRLLKSSGNRFFRELSTHLDVAGNAYVWKQRAGSGMPVKLRLLRPDLTKPIPGADGEVRAYWFGRDPNAQEIPKSEVIHVMGDPDPLDPYRGLSPIAVLARMGDVDNNAMDYLRAFFMNAAIPSGLLVTKQQIDQQQVDSIRERWRARFTGLRGWHELAIIDGTDADYKEIGSKLRTLDLESVFGQTESRICSAFGVPPILVGAWIGLLRSSYANYASARKSFYQETLIPRWASVEDTLTQGLAPDFGSNIEIRFDLSKIDALQEEKTEVRKFALDAWDSGLATKNEARQLVGWPEDDAGNVYKQRTTEIYLDAGEEPMIGIDEMHRIVSARTQLMLGPGETHEAKPEEWRMLHAIADAARPKVKKKS